MSEPDWVKALDEVTRARLAALSDTGTNPELSGNSGELEADDEA